MTREVKLGLFTIIVLAISIWGYKYLKGQNLLSKSYTFNVEYDDVTQLSISSPVLLNGLAVGSITTIKIDEQDVTKMIVTFNLDGDYKIPNDATVYQVNNGLMNGKALSIKLNKLCSGSDCAKNGSYLNGKVLGMVESMLGGDDISGYVSDVTKSVNTTISQLGSKNSDGALNESIRNLNLTLQHVEQLSKTTDNLVKKSYSNLSKSIENVGLITDNLAQNNSQITGLLNNLNSITDDIKSAKLSSTINTSNATLEESKVAIQQLQKTLEKADGMMESLNSVVQKLDDGKGSMSKLMNDEQLYNNLNATSENLSLLLQDLRLNPHRYVNVSIFGKKNKPYAKPEYDPAEAE